MDAVLQAPPVTRVLLWKEVQQAKLVAWALLLMMGAVQVFAFLAARYAPPEWIGGFEFFVISPLVASPFLFVLGAVGMSVGHERQVGSWEWNSSLPVSWLHSLVVKLITIIVAALVVTLVLSVVPALHALVWREPLSASRVEFDWQLLPLEILSGMVGVVALVVLCTVSALLIRDTLTALATAAVPFMVLMLGFGFVVTSSWPYASRGAVLQAYCIFGGGLAVVGLAVLFPLYRWRWTTGQRCELVPSFGSRSSSTSARYKPSAVRQQSPSQFTGLLRMASANWFWSRILIVVGTLAFAGLLTPSEPQHWTWVAFCLAFASGLLGISVFAGDQTNKRYRFLADHGVSPIRVLGSRLLIPAACLLLLIAVATFRVTWRDYGYYVSVIAMPRCIALSICTVALLGYVVAYWRRSVLAVVVAVLSLVCVALAVYLFRWMLPLLDTPENLPRSIELTVCLFLLSAYASLCFQRPVVAMVVAALTVFCGSMALYSIGLLSFIFSLSDYNAEGGWLLSHTIGWCWLGMLVGGIALHRGVHKWLLRSETRLSMFFPLVAVIAMLVPLWCAATFGFLFVPTPISKPEVHSQIGYTVNMPPDLTGVIALGDSRRGPAFGTLVHEPVHPSVVFDYYHERYTSFADEVLLALSQSDSYAESSTVGAASRYQARLMSVRSAGSGLLNIALSAASNEDWELAAQAWGGLYQILQAGGPGTWSDLEDLRENCSLAWGGISNEQMQELRNASTTSDFGVPAGVETKYSSEIGSYRRAVLLAIIRGERDVVVPSGAGLSDLASLRSSKPGVWLCQYYPPIAWRLEREIMLKGN